MASGNDAFDSALERMRNERRAELAQLNRVTAQRTAQFMQRAQKLEQFLSADSGNEPVGSSGSSHQGAEPTAILVEIRALVESRPVSSILQASRFRDELENSILNGLQPQGVQYNTSTASVNSVPASTGAAATPITANQTTDLLRSILNTRRDMWQQELNSLLERGIVSHLINSGFREQLNSIFHGDHADRNLLEDVDGHSDDNISIISATAQTVPSSHTTSGLVKQIETLRTEMKECKNMIRMLFDCQLETNRCIKQVMAPFLEQNAEARSAQRQVEAFTSVRGTECVVCMDRPADTMVYRCGHLCLCHPCSLALPHHSSSPTCPVCRGRVTDTVRVFAHKEPA